MEKENNYFKDIEGIGNLHKTYDIFCAWYDILFICEDDNSNVYLCVCYDNEESKKWIISKTTDEVIKGILTDKITLKESFRSPYNLIYVAEYSRNDNSCSYKKVLYEDIDEIDLPDDEYLEVEDGEFDDYLKKGG